MPVLYREATVADVPAMARSRLGDAAAGRADERMAAYLERKHHPQQALEPRVAYVALDADTVVGYIAGHLTRRFGCDGEVQYLFVAPSRRRRRLLTSPRRRVVRSARELGAAPFRHRAARS